MTQISDPWYTVNPGVSVAKTNLILVSSNFFPSCTIERLKSDVTQFQAKSQTTGDSHRSGVAWFGLRLRLGFRLQAPIDTANKAAGRRGETGSAAGNCARTTAGTDEETRYADADAEPAAPA